METLKGTPLKWTQEKLILLFKDLATRIGEQPTKKQWNDDAKMPSDMPVRQRFGNWNNFLKIMGLKPIKWIPSQNGFTRKGTRNKTRKEIIDGYGYINVFEPKHPMARKNGYIKLHRKIMYDAGLLKNSVLEVHHLNGNK